MKLYVTIQTDRVISSCLTVKFDFAFDEKSDVFKFQVLINYNLTIFYCLFYLFFPIATAYCNTHLDKR